MRLAIIGAGMAGLAAARALRQLWPELTITLYEQSSDLGGRVATGRRDGFVFDHGAQYAKAATPALERLLTAELPADDLRDIGKPVWTFDGAGVLAAGDPAQNADAKWTYRTGLDRLGELLGAGLDVRRGVTVGWIRRTTSYELFDSDKLIAEADLVLLTPPAPQTAELLSASDIDPAAKTTLLGELARVTYRRCISLALAYDRRIERPFYALVNTDRQHPISWLALEHDKGPQRCPPGHSLLLAQLAPQWSRDHWATPPAELTTLVSAQAGALLGEELRAPLWCDVRRWRDALPDGGSDLELLNGCDTGLFFAGDYTAGQGRVHLAIESGWRAATAIDAYLKSL